MSERTGRTGPDQHARPGPTRAPMPARSAGSPRCGTRAVRGLHDAPRFIHAHPRIFQPAPPLTHSSSSGIRRSRARSQGSDERRSPHRATAPIVWATRGAVRRAGSYWTRRQPLIAAPCDDAPRRATMRRAATAGDAARHSSAVGRRAVLSVGGSRRPAHHPLGCSASLGCYPPVLDRASAVARRDSCCLARTNRSLDGHCRRRRSSLPWAHVGGWRNLSCGCGRRS